MTAPVSAKRARPTWRDYLRAFGRSHRTASVEFASSLPLLRHLEELRGRLFVALAALAVTTVLSFIFVEPLVDFFTQPIGGRAALVSIEVTENVAIFMRVSLLCGLTAAMPFVVYEALAFVLPGLNARERSWLLVGVPLASLLFVAGVAFAWYIMIPTAVPFLTSFLGITTHVRPANYFAFITTLMFWMGVSFQMPLVAMLLARLQLITARQLAQGWRYALVGISVMAAAITPTVDPVNMGLVMLPLSGLYLLSILLAALARRG
ncbi:MAG: twin-arginine translocase subunit TatC [Anaerolineales bacterium]|nr:twin-arginine translocase subunit TatC [Anaerolineales bacterium]